MSKAPKLTKCHTSSLILAVLMGLCTSTHAAVDANNPCGGAYTLLAQMDRPSFGDSACTASYKTAILETGYQFVTLLGAYEQHNAPNAFLRVGLPHAFEVNVSLPNYTHQTVTPFNGWSPSSLGVKHELAAHSDWVTSIEGVVILPSGSASLGSKKTGIIVNGLFTRTLTDNLSLAGQLGMSSQSDPIESGGLRYSSTISGIVLSWSQDRLNLFGELYGQSCTGPGQSGGFVMDYGVIYLIKKHIALDFEFGHGLGGALFGINRYVGTGISIQFT